MSSLGDASAMTTTTSPTTDWHFRTTSRSFPLSAGPAVEFRLGGRTTVSAEFLFQRLRYDKVATILTGTDDPNTGNDERSSTTRTEKTKARLWDAPVLVHYRVGSSGALSRFYVAGGASVRSVSTVRTTTETLFANGDKSSSSAAARIAKRNLIGATIGVGFRFIDDFNVKTTPEIRFTRWSGRTFDSDSTRSAVNQLEFGIGFTF